MCSDPEKGSEFCKYQAFSIYSSGKIRSTPLEQGPQDPVGLEQHLVSPLAYDLSVA